MASLNVFEHDAFSLTSLTAALQNVPYQPNRLAGLFEEDGIIGLDFYIEIEDGVMDLVPVSARGAPAAPAAKGARKAKSFRVAHLRKNSAVLADEILGVRAFGSETETETMAKVVLNRFATMRRNLEYTFESHRLSALKGLMIDSLGNNVDLYAEFGVARQSVDFALGTATTEVRAKADEVLVTIEDALGGLSFNGVTVLCGQAFWRDLIAHKSVKESYLGTVQAAELRGDPRQSFEFGGLSFERYRGTSAVKVDDNEAIAVPTGVSGLCLTRFAAADWIETVNTLGQRMYAKQWEMEAGRGINLEAQSSPINLVTRPGAIVRLKRAG